MPAVPINGAMPPVEPLLYVPTHPARTLDADLTRAGIPKEAVGGKLDFHAVRLAYINLVLETGATVKEAQTLARHATPQMTLGVYGRTREERLHEVVEQVAIVVQGKTQRAVSVHSSDAAENKSCKRFCLERLQLFNSSGGGGNRTRVRKSSATASTHAFPGRDSTPNLPGRARRVFAWFKFRPLLLQAWENGGYPTS